MKAITQKSVVRKELEHCLNVYTEKDSAAFLNALHARILQAKIKFPLLEYCATEMYQQIPAKAQLKICDDITALKTIGGNVLLGIILQKRLKTHFEESISKAAVYIEQGAEWYVTDIIGERVFGWSLLHHFSKTLTELKKLGKHKSNWVVRSIGPGAHYAIK